MKLGIDIDGVCADFQGGWARVYDHWWPGRRNLNPSAMGSWDALVRATHFPTTQDFWDWADVARVWDSLPVMPGAQGALWDLSERHEVHFVTARHPSIELETAAWLEHHFAFALEGMSFARTNVHHTKDKLSVDCAVYVDDSPDVLQALHLAGRTTIRYKHPWNTGVMATMSARNWSVVGTLIQFLETE